MKTFPIQISPTEANLATAAVMCGLYAAFGEDPLRWKKMDNKSRETIDLLQAIHLRLEYFLDPWGSDVNYFSVTVREAKLMRLCFRIFSDCFSGSSQKELRDIFRQVDEVDWKRKGLQQGFWRIDDRLVSLIKKEGAGIKQSFRCHRDQTSIYLQN